MDNTDFRIRTADAESGMITWTQLQHPLKDLHGRTLILPRKRGDMPEKDRIALRYEFFRRAV